jgi:hypothetical protein
MSRLKLKELLAKAAGTIVVQPTYDNLCMQRRDERLVELATHIISCFDGIPGGGTWNTLEYARQRGVPVVCNIDPKAAGV